MDDAVIRDLVERDYSRIVASVALITGSRATAEDAVQEAIARAWERSEQGFSIDVLPAWVTTCASNLGRSQVRRLFAEARARGRLRPPGSESDLVDSAGDRVDLRTALAALPQRQRETVVLRYHLGSSIEEIAVAMGVSTGTVKTQLHRARAALADALAVHIDEEVPGHG